MNYINPKVDIAFKKIFGVEENKDLLISLINSIVSPKDQVADVTLLNPYNQSNFRNDKLSILDIKALGQNSKVFNIELQIINHADYDKRALYYWAKTYTEQLQAGDSYSKLSKAIGIHILNFLSIPNTANYHNVFHITEKQSGFSYFDDLELHTIELKKFTPDTSIGLDELLTKLKTSLDIWSAFLTRHDLLQPDTLPRSIANPNLEKALKVLEVMNFNSSERMLYEDHIKWLLTEGSGLSTAHAEGHEEGIEKGRAEGRAAEKLDIAKNLRDKGLDLASIISVTGISDEQLLELNISTEA